MHLQIGELPNIVVYCLQTVVEVMRTHDIIFGTFRPRELARFKELLEKPVRLKPGWPDNEDMAT
ncbi:hypothetical protein Gotur_002894 [Gossypium turneri]